VASPRLLALNNEPAIVRMESAAFSVTPQIGADSALTLSLSPIVKAPATAETDMIARVADGETLVIWASRATAKPASARRLASPAGGRPCDGCHAPESRNVIC